jgi:hypothetical protein
MAELNPLRRRMIEDMKVRNLSPVTRRCYVRAVAKFAQDDIGDLQPHHLRYPEPGGVGGHQRRPVLRFGTAARNCTTSSAVRIAGSCRRFRA